MAAKHLVTCPLCGFGVSDQGDAANPGLTGDIRAFTRTCEHTAEVLGSADERPFGCPELLEAVHAAAVSEEVSDEFTVGSGPGMIPREQSGGRPAIGVPPTVEEKGDVSGEP